MENRNDRKRISRSNKPMNEEIEDIYETVILQILADVKKQIDKIQDLIRDIKINH